MPLDSLTELLYPVWVGIILAQNLTSENVAKNYYYKFTVNWIVVHKRITAGVDVF